MRSSQKHFPVVNTSILCYKMPVLIKRSVSSFFMRVLMFHVVYGIIRLINDCVCSKLILIRNCKKVIELHAAKMHQNKWYCNRKLLYLGHH